MSFSDTWPNATAEGGADPDGPPPEGVYEAALTAASAFVSRKGAEIVRLGFRALGPSSSGHEWTVIHGFGNQGQANATKAICSRLGVEVDKDGLTFEELDTELGAHIGCFYDVRIVRNGEYMNTYVDGSATPSVETQQATASDFVAIAGDPGPEPDTPAYVDDDIPF